MVLTKTDASAALLVGARAKDGHVLLLRFEPLGTKSLREKAVESQTKTRKSLVSLVGIWTETKLSHIRLPARMLWDQPCQCCVGLDKFKLRRLGGGGASEGTQKMRVLCRDE